MKKKLFLVIMIISVVASVLAFIFTTMIYHDFYVEDAENQIKTIAELSSDSVNWENNAKINSSVNKILSAVDYNIRFTLIDLDGNVIYDSWAGNKELENHLDRPEVIQAFKRGSGEYTRYSQTISSNMYYYALKTSDNDVLRLSREIKSINGVFIELVPMLVVLFFGFLVFNYIVANIFTKKLLNPIDDMILSLDDMLEGNEDFKYEIYDEFQPLALKIREQKENINQYIDKLKYERDTIGIITENMKEGFILINKDKHILSINSSGKRMIGNEKFDFNQNRYIIELTRNPEILDRVDTSLNENSHIVYDMTIKQRHYRYYFSPVKERYSRSVAGLLVLIEDVTVQKNAEIMRSEFSANVSHELKTPLTTMIGFAELIKEGLVTDLDSIRRYCTMINKEGLRLISLIEDIMRLSKIEAGLDPNETLVNVKLVSQEAINLLKPKAEKSNVKLNLESEDVSINANKNYISELLYNLIDNAIKYNKQNGLVNVNIYKDRDNLFIKVKDNGVGISEEDQERIFERFYRVDKSRSKETGGTGLGLSIVKHIAELYDGNIELNSKRNKGTEITVIIPLN